MDSRGWVVMLSGSPWRAAAHRQQALARRLTAAYHVLFVDPPGSRPRRGLRVDPLGERLWRATPPVVAPLWRHLPPVNRLGRHLTARAIRRWLDQRGVTPGPARVLWLDEDLAESITIGETARVYDATDLDWTFTRAWNRWHLRGALRRAVAGADLVFVSSAELPAHLPPTRRAPVLLANACDPEQFRPDGPTASWLDAIPRPRLGYLGSIDTRAFDAELVAAVARAHPDWSFVLVGRATEPGRRPLAGLSNVHVFDAVPFDRAADVVRACDVGIIPYRVGGLIDYVHPKKCFEYLAAGLPVAATGLPAVQALRPLVRVGDGPAGFGAAVGRALRCAGCPVKVWFSGQVAAVNSWDQRGRQLLTHLAELGAPR